MSTLGVGDGMPPVPAKLAGGGTILRSASSSPRLALARGMVREKEGSGKHNREGDGSQQLAAHLCS